MCGICGGMALNQQGGSYLNRIPDAIECLRLRGPDQKGIFIEDAVALGQTRLSVIDLSDAASQPFTDASGRFTIVYNGEIYNFREIRKTLEQKGVTFRSNSDTEVILYAFITEGPSFIEKLNGFFAFCIYDNLLKTLFLARDRMGIKPLYYFHNEEVFLFASELKALMALGIPRNIDPVSVFTYLQLNYIPAPATVFSQVQKLMPGHFMVLHGGNPEIRPYYTIPVQKNNGQHDSYETACSRVRELMEQSVQRRMISDVPLGTFLSGGIDSGIITGLAARMNPSLKTFSIGFQDEPLFDETRYAEETARLHKTDHHSFRLTTDDLFDILPKVLDYTDEPYADSSALAMYILSHETRKHVTVALSGDGADELYGGYIKHRAECRIRNAGLSEQLVKWGHPLWKVLPQSRNSKYGNKIRQLQRFATGSAMNPADRYWRWASLAGEQEASGLTGFDFTGSASYQSLKAGLLSDIRGREDLNEVLLNDMHLVLLNDMLVKVDLMSMSNSLEVRVPFLDHEHVGYAFSLPWQYKFGKNQGKKILRDTFRDLLPESILNRPKHGFEVPLLKWFRTDLHSYIHKDLLGRDLLKEQGIFQPEAVQQLLLQLDSNNPGDAAGRVWALVVFQYWWLKYF